MADSILSLKDLRALAKARKQTTVASAIKSAGPAQTVLAEVRKRDTLANLRDVLPTLPGAVDDAIKAMKPADAANKTRLELARAAIKAAKIDAKDRKALEAQLAEIDLVEALGGRDGSASETLDDLPEIQVELERAKVAELTAIAGLSDAASNALLERVATLDALGEQRVAALVIDGKLKEQDALRLGMIGGLAQFLGNETETVERIANTSFKVLKGKVKALPDLLRVDDETLAKALDPELAEKDAKAANAEAQGLRIRIEERFPLQGLDARMKPAPQSLRSSIQKVRKILKNMPDALDAAPVSLGLKKPEADALAEVQAAVNAYPGLGMREIVAADAAPQETIAEIEKRVEIYEAFEAQNADAELLRMDMTPGSDDLKSLNFRGIPKEAQEGVINVVKARARAHRAGGTVRNAAALMKGGYHSSMAIAASEPADISKHTGMALGEARVVYEMARDARVSVTNLVATLADELRWDFTGHYWGWFVEDVSDGLKKLPGYQDLFGDQSFCSCAHCDSILSPAAYFVDLMNFVDEKVTTKDFKGATANHKLKLQSRRPDLWTVPLTCDNTHDLVPTLEIINEILETAIAKDADAGINMADTAAVQAKVYEEVLPGAVRSFVTPFDLRVAEADEYIQDFDTDRAEIGRLMQPGASDEESNAAALKLALDDYRMITTARTQWAFLQSLYRMDFPHTGSKADPFDVQQIMAGMDISREAFGNLVATDFVQGGDNIQIKAQKRSTASVQNDIEKVSGMTQGALDRAHRFWRLSRALGWHMSELDLALARAGGTLADTPIAALVSLHRQADRLGLDIAETLALSGPIPDVPLAGEDLSLMDDLFNKPRNGATQTPFPAPTVRFVHPGLRDDASLPEVGPNAGVFISQRLRVALGLNEADLLALIVMLAPALGIDPAAAAENDRGFLLTQDALALLYRHALLADALGLDVEELALAIEMAGAGNAVVTADHLTLLLDFTESLGEVPFDLLTAAALMGVIADPVAEGLFIDADATADAVIAAIADNELAVFAPTIFAFLDGVSEDQSQAIAEANASLLDAAPRDMLRLKPDIGLAPAVVAPAGGFPAGIAAADLQAVLDEHNLRVILPRQLAATLDMETDKLDAIAALSGVDLTAQPVVDAANGMDPAPLRAAVRSLARPLASLDNDAATASRVAFIDTNRALFDLIDPVAPYARHTVLAIGAYLAALEDGDGIENHAETVDAVLLAHTVAQRFAAADTAQLAQVTGGQTASVRVFEASAALPDLAALALHRLRMIVTFAGDRKLDADAMALLASSDPVALGQGAQSLKAALQLRLGDPASFASVTEAHEDALRGRRRDALTDYMIRTSAGRFEDRGDLYNYYLIDPDMEGCARTSRVVSATGSLQTYIHRIVLNLEQDRRDADAANHIHISPSRIPAGEWEWRKNYRVWEANRKVFLWPENYMLPELRDNKTPLFEELEKTLLQQDITEQTVLDAYAAYLRGFEEVASLRIAGAFHEHLWSGTRDVLHVFGCTADDPPTYYYWTVENLTFSKLVSNRRVSYSARRKIDVTIGARDVSPVIFNNRLHVFWVETTTSSRDEIEDGENKWRGYRHTFRVMYTALKLDGTWTAPQQLSLGANYPLKEGGILNEGLTFRDAGVSLPIPTYSDVLVGHSEYQEGYRLRAPAWQKVYPALRGEKLFFNLGTPQRVFEVDMFERSAVEPDSDTTDTLDTYWRSNRQTLHIRKFSSGRYMYEQVMTHPTWQDPASPPARMDYHITFNGLKRNVLSVGIGEDWANDLIRDMNFGAADLGATIAKVNDDTARALVPNSDWGYPETFIQKDSDVSFFSWSYDWDRRPYEARRLGTTVLTDLSRTLFYGGVDALLDKQTQADFAEKTHLVSSRNYRTKVRGPTNKLDFTGPLGVYFREIFMHIPALLAGHQNGRGDHAAAQGWYQTLFDPTADFDSDVDLSGLSESARLRAERDRVWQYAEFQGMVPPKLRDILTDEDAQEAYRKDPFNPYAIARLRLSAFQKNIVMRYVDNLLDWADGLFRQFQRETVHEAHVLYDIARQILGPRPADVGDCGEGKVRPRTYANIKPHMDKGQDFLIEAETFWLHHSYVSAKDFQLAPTAKRKYIQVERADLHAIDLQGKIESKVASQLRFDSARQPGTAEAVALSTRGATEQMLADDKTVAHLDDVLTGLPKAPQMAEYQAAEMRYTDALARDGSAGRQFDWKRTGKVQSERSFGRLTGTLGRNWRDWGHVRPDDFTVSVVRQIGPVFCVPRNKDLLALWDRVDDRLWKIHNCRNIDGERVDMALFAPEIDPMALVRAKAAGLSLSDIMGAGAGNLPPYRFTYLIAKAREYTSMVQGFGAKLQGAIERRDSEELATLRLAQAINMQNLVTRIRENEVKIAKENLDEINRRKAAMDYKLGYYEGLISEDLLPWERAQQVMTHTSTISYALSATLAGTAGIFYLIPQLGSPFAMKYGGSEMGHSAEEWSKVFSDTAKMTDVMGKSASLEAGFDRRRKGWEHQKKLGELDLKQIEKSIIAAEIRVEIAEKALENHHQAIEDQEELLDFYESKFSNEALYTWMASTLQTIYRDAFNAALSMAKLAEQAYRFERAGDNATLLEMPYWDAGRAGLLSGDKLAVDLVAMEKRFLETNYRKLEINQPFSLQQIDPGALMRLRETGECEFVIPELAFDLLYPGQYRRRVQAARLSIACVTGPYVNIPATLTLTGAKMRTEPTQDGPAGLVDSLLRHTVQIATSTAQNDAGVFDFGFNDARYMPFEGAGAVESKWKVTLPKTFRPFDYATINDVVLHLSYSAESDGTLRDHVESNNTALEGALTQVLSDTPLPRAFSIRQDFSTAFHQLLNNAENTDTVIAIDERAMPLALRGRDVQIERAILLLKPGNGLGATGTEITVNGQAISGFTALPEFPHYLGTDMSGAFAGGILGDHVVSISDSGDLALGGGGAAAIAQGALKDLVLYFEMTLD
ncbi:neuraminidase-like domain-containing protein [Roseovarius sp. S4756]|uniref:Tc toxin subunit A-related protein n=1 Tax=Roseovarius maritimus TaxID=3342637 RepID=UPI003728199A